MRRLTAVLTFVAILWGIAGCDSSDSEPASTEAASSLTTDPAPVEVVEVVFDGTECRVNPDSVAAGDHAFVLTNTSDIEVLRGDMYVGNVPDGLLYQDVLDRQMAHGGPPNTVPTPEWEGEGGLGITYEAPSFATPPDIELADNQTLLLASLTAGTDFVELYNNANPTNDWQQWLCTPALEVTQ